MTERLVTIQEASGEVVHAGTVLTDFRGDAGVFVQPTRAGAAGGPTGKVLVTERGARREYYESVYGLVVRAANDMFPCGCPAEIVADEGHQVGCFYRS